jgi:hypothetical protein
MYLRLFKPKTAEGLARFEHAAKVMIDLRIKVWRFNCTMWRIWRMSRPLQISTNMFFECCIKLTANSTSSGYIDEPLHPGKRLRKGFFIISSAAPMEYWHKSKPSCTFTGGKFIVGSTKYLRL